MTDEEFAPLVQGGHVLGLELTAEHVALFARFRRERAIHVPITPRGPGRQEAAGQGGHGTILAAQHGTRSGGGMGEERGGTQRGHRLQGRPQHVRPHGPAARDEHKCGEESSHIGAGYQGSGVTI